MGEEKQFGRYEVRSTIGRGAMGVVYLAEDPVIGRKVAIKVVEAHDGLEKDELEQLQARFEREFQSAGRLSHPNIVSVHDVGQQGGNTFIAMEYVQGESLHSVLAESRAFSFKEIADLAAQLCSALDYAHEYGIVHRDIKPANIMITRDGRPKITDFGVAKVATTTLTRTGTVVGTPAYMSPEQVTGHPVSGAADQFSLAVMIYQMITGERPFTGENPTTIMYKIVHEEPLKPSALNVMVPARVDEALIRALTKNPEDRYPTCAELADALRDALGAAPAEATVVMSTGGTDATVVDPSIAMSHAAAAGKIEKKGGLSVAALAVVGFVFVAVALGAWAWSAGMIDDWFGDPGTEESGAATPAPVQLALTINIVAPEGLAIWVDSVDTGTLTTGVEAPVSIDLAGATGESRTVQLRVGDNVLASQTFTLVEDLAPEWQPPDIDTAMVAAGIPVPGAATSDPAGADPTAGEEVSEPVPFTITSNPPGARVTFDGELLETVTPVEVPVDLGIGHSIVVEAAGYEQRSWSFNEEQLTPSQRESRQLHFPLESSVPPGSLSIENRYGYLVALTITPRDGSGRAESYEAAINHNIRLRPGTYNVEISAPQILWSDTRVITIGSEETRSTPLPAMTTVRVLADPGRCVISIDGREIGPPPFNQDLAVGSQYTFTFDWTELGQGTKEKQVRITRNIRTVSEESGGAGRRSPEQAGGGAR